MKLQATLLLLAAGFSLVSCKARESDSEAKSLKDVSSVQRNDKTGMFHVICIDGSEQDIPIDKFESTPVADICPNVGGQGPIGDPSSKLFADGNCSQNQFVGLVNSQTNCQAGSNQTVGSVQSGGQCTGLPQTISFSRACEVFKVGSVGVALHASGGCQNSGSILAFVTPNTNCDQIANSAANFNVASVQTGNACIGLPQQLSVRSACLQFKNFKAVEGRELHAAGNCQGGSLLAKVSPSSDCNQIQNNAPNFNVAAVRIQDRCVGLPQQISVFRGCEVFKGDGEITLHASGNCQGNILAITSKASDCGKLSQNAANFNVASVAMPGGTCHRLPQQISVERGCEIVRHAAPNRVELFADSTCGGNFMGSVDATSDCQKLASFAPNFNIASVKIEGQCHGLSQQLSVQTACQQFKPQ